MAKLTLNNLTSGFASTATLNANFDAIEAAIENTLSRNGTTPNQMQADLDMNSNSIINLASLDVASLMVNGVPVTTPELSVSEVPAQATHTGKFLQTNGIVASWQVPDATEISFTQADVNATSTTVGEKLQERVSVKDFGAVGDGVTDDTTALQNAIDSGMDLIFPTGDYAVGPLTQATNFQRFYATGQVNILKNTNGDLFTGSGNYVEFNGIQFNGADYTGDNVVLSGNHPRLLNCSSYRTPGRAVKATGSHVQIIGTCGSYTTTDATASGYDIEIGQSGTATLYHQLYGVYTSQATGGFLFIDTGSQAISGCQFGKLTIQAGTKPAGVNGGNTHNSRILGTVLVEISNAIFAGNQFSTQTITFASGTSACTLDNSNTLNNATIVNSGNNNSVVIKSIGTGSPEGIVLQYGSDAFNSTIRYSNNEIYLEDSNLSLANNKAVKFADSGGTLYSGLSLSSGDDWTLGWNNGTNYMNISAGTGGIYLAIGGASIFQATATQFRPQTDNTYQLGNASQRFKYTYSTEIRPGAGSVIWTSGAGTPESAVTAPVGSLYTRTDGGVNTTLYVKESGTGNTGWVAK